MTIEEANRNLGNLVAYIKPYTKELGVITKVTDKYVFVRYRDERTAKATYPRDLELVGNPPNKA